MPRSHVPFDDTTPVPPPGLEPVSMARRIMTLPIDEIGPSPLQPRQHIVETDRSELMQSIKVHGVIEPLVVRERPQDQLAAGKYTAPYELVAGEQRWTTAKRAGVTEIDVVVRELTDAQVIEFGLVENLRRTNLHPMDEAAAYEKLIAMNPSYTDEALADRVGKDVSTIRKRRKLLRLVPSAREAFLHGAITVKHAEKLSTVAVAQQPAALAECFSNLLVFEGDPEVEAAELEAYKEEDFDGDMIDVLIFAGLWHKLEIAQRPVGDLDEWLRRHGKADVSDVDVQAQLGLDLASPAVTDVAAATGAAPADDPVASLLQLSESNGWNFNQADAKALGVLHKDRWREIHSDRDACDYAQRGVVVHGGDLRLVDRVCAVKRCHKHWPPAVAKKAPVSQDKSDADLKWERQQAMAREKEEAWAALKPKAQRAFAAHVNGLKVSAQLVERFIMRVLGRHRVADVKDAYGVALTDSTLGAFLACATVPGYSQEEFAAHARAFGFDVKTVMGKLAKPAATKAAATKAPAKKAAPKKKPSAPVKKAKAPKAAGRKPTTRKKGR